MTNDLAIPGFLKRQNKDETMIAKPKEKKIRTKTMLPTSLQDVSGSETLLSSMSLTDLVTAKINHETLIGDMDKFKLQLRAINVEIRKHTR